MSQNKNTEIARGRVRVRGRGRAGGREEGGGRKGEAEKETFQPRCLTTLEPKKMMMKVAAPTNDE
jgi:hypothetical protein